MGEQYILDILGSIISERSVRKYVHVAVENMSRLVIPKVVDSISSKSLLDFLEQEIILKYGCFNSLVLDKHPVHPALRENSEKYRFELMFNPSYSHSAIGLCENAQKPFNKSLNFIFKMM